MAEKSVDHAKLQQFVEAALSNPQHPVYRLGLTHSPMLQHYAFNVSLLASVKPEDWFAQYPKYTEQLTEVMRLCEAEGPESGAPAPLTQADLDALKAKIAELENRISLAAAPAAHAERNVPAEGPADDASDGR